MSIIESEATQELQVLRAPTIPISDVPGDSPWRISQRYQLDDYEKNHRVVGSSSRVDGLKMIMEWTDDVPVWEVACWWNELEQKGYVSEFYSDSRVCGRRKERMELIYPPKQIISILPRENWLQIAEMTIIGKRRESRRLRNRKVMKLLLALVCAGGLGWLLEDYWTYL